MSLRRLRRPAHAIAARVGVHAPTVDDRKLVDRPGQLHSLLAEDTCSRTQFDPFGALEHRDDEVVADPASLGVIEPEQAPPT